MMYLFTDICNDFSYQVSNIIFVDLPASTGFTYATTESGTQRSDSILVQQALQFLRKVYTPKFLLISFNNHFFLCF